MLGGKAMMDRSRKPEIMADAAYAVFCRESRSCTGNFLVDEQVLAEEGVTDLTHYAVNPELEPVLDFFLD